LKNRHYLFLLTAVLGAALVVSCAPKKKLKIEEKPKEEVKVEPTPTPIPSPTPEEIGIIKITQDWTDVPALELIHFAYDSAQLDDAARAMLKKNVAVLKKLPQAVTFRVEGHCDQRGTVEYNIALGQRRASAVSNFYRASGISKDRIKTISFGHERPLCTESTEDCWGRNRRSVTKVRAEQPLTVKEGDLK